MKKSIYTISAALVLILTSCGPKTPNEFAERKIKLEIKELELQTEAYETATRNKDRNFHDNLQMEVRSLSEDDKELKELAKELEYARQEYKDMVYKSRQSKNSYDNEYEMPTRYYDDEPVSVKTVDAYDDYDYPDAPSY